MNRYLLPFLLGLNLLLASNTQADDIDELMAVLSGFQYLQGSFEQHQFDEQGEDLGVSKGQFKLLRPGYFSWDIQTPDSQLIVASPDYIWHHDRDLETVTRRPVGEGMDMTPLQILGGEEQALRANYDVTMTASAGADAGTTTTTGGDTHFRLRPLSNQESFSELTLITRDNQVTSMEVLDAIGQRFVIRFSRVDQDSVLTADDFVFSPPEGADLFYHDQ